MKSRLKIKMKQLEKELRKKEMISDNLDEVMKISRGQAKKLERYRKNL